MRLKIYTCILSETIETYWRDALRIAFESPRKCVRVTSEFSWVTSELPFSHPARNCAWDNSELRLSHLGTTFESPRNYVCMTLISKLVAFTWPLVTYRVPPVNCLITKSFLTVLLMSKSAFEYVFLFFIIDYRNFLKRWPQNWTWVTSEMRLSDLGNAFESPRNHVWVTLNVKLIAITWPLVTYRGFPVNGLISEVIPHGPEHACVWIYIPVFYHRLSELTDEMPSELHLSHLGIAFESPRNCLWVT